MLYLSLAAAQPVITSNPDLVVQGSGWWSYGVVLEDPGAGVSVTAPQLPPWVELSFEEAWVSSTLAGAGDLLFPGGPGETGFVDGTSEDARFRNMYGITVDAAGNRFVADTHNHAIRRIDGFTGMVTTLAGDGTPGHLDGDVSVSRLFFPQGLDLGPDGFLYVADAFNNCIRRVDPDTGEITTVAGVPGVPGGDDGPVATATFNRPKGIAVDANGTIWVADTDNHAIRRIEQGQVSVVAGVSTQAGLADGQDALFNSPRGMEAVDGGLYIADKDNHRIVRLDLTSFSVETLAGTGQGGRTDGPVDTASFFHPFDVAVDTVGALYIVDSSNHLVRRISGGQVETLAGDADQPRWRDGVGARASFYFPRSLAIDGDGSLLISDRSNGAVRRLEPAAAVLRGTATPAELGEHEVTVEVTGPDGSDTQSFLLDVTGFNQAPLIEGLSQTFVDEGAFYSFTPTASDPDGDPLVFHSYQLPSWASFDSNTGTIEGTPGFDDAQVYPQVAVTADDGTGMDNSTATLKPYVLVVRDVNRVPEVVGAPTEGFVGEAWHFQPVVTDPDGDVLELTPHGLPPWMDFHQGRFEGIPDAEGSVVFGLSVSDGRASLPTQVDFQLDVSVRNAAPQPQDGAPSQTIPVEQSTRVVVPPEACIDPDGDPLVYRAEGPSWASLEGMELVLEPPQSAHGAHTVDLFATDGRAESLCGSVELEVVDELAPVITFRPPGGIDRLTRFGIPLETSEPLAWLDSPDFVAENAEVLAVQSSPEGIVIVVRALEEADLSITLPAGSVEDRVGNPNTVDTVAEIPWTGRLAGEPLPEASSEGCSVLGGSGVWLGGLLLPLLRRRSLHP